MPLTRILPLWLAISFLVPVGLRAQVVDEGEAEGHVVENPDQKAKLDAQVAVISERELNRAQHDFSKAVAWRRVGTTDGHFYCPELQAGAWHFYAFASSHEGRDAAANIHSKAHARAVPDPIKLDAHPAGQGAPSRPAGRAQIVLALARVNRVRLQGPPGPSSKERFVLDERRQPIEGAVVSIYYQKPLNAGQIEITRWDKGNGPFITSSTGGFALDLRGIPASEEYLLTVAKFGYRSRIFVVDGNLDFSHIDDTVELQPESDFGEIAGAESSDASRRSIFTGAVGRTLEAVPLQGSRTLDSLALTSPGIFPPAETRDNHGPSFSPGIGTAGAFSVNGIRSRETAFTADGGDDNDELTGTRRQGFLFSSSRPPESVQEFQVVSALPDARFGRGTSAQVNIISKTDLGNYHASVYGFVTNEALKARDFFENTGASLPPRFPVLRPSDGTPVFVDGQQLKVDNPAAGRPGWSRTQSGVLFAGPIHHMYSTAGFEAQIQRGDQESHFAVPTVDERRLSPEVLSALPNGSFPVTVPGDAVFSYFPFPNNPRGPFGANTYTAPLPIDGTGARWFVKLEQKMPRSGDVGGRAGFRYSHSIESAALPSSAGGIDSTLNSRIQNFDFAEYGGVETLTSVHNFRIALAWTLANLAPRMPTPNLKVPPLLLDVTPVTAGRVQADEQYLSASSPSGAALLSTLGYPSTPTAENVLGPFGQLMLAGYSPVGIDPFFLPQLRTDFTGEIGYAGSLVRGHSIYLFGFEFNGRSIDLTNDPNLLPQITFSGLPSVFPVGGSLADASSTSLAASGLPTGVFQTFSDFRKGFPYEDSRGLKYFQESLYFQHERSIRQDLRMTVGARVEIRDIAGLYTTSLADNFKRSVLLSDAAAAEATCFLPCSGLASAIGQAFPASYPNLAITRFAIGPRLGFAWSPGSHRDWAIRAGYGVYPGAVSGFAANDLRQGFNQFIPLNLANSPLFTSQGEFLLNLGNHLVRQLRPDLNIVPTNAVNFSEISVNFLQLLTQSLANLSAFGAPPTFGALTLSRAAPKLANPYAQHYAVTIERELPERDLERTRILEGAVFSLAYVGTRGINLIRPETPQGGPLRSSMTINQVSTTASGFPAISATSKPAQPTLAGGIVAIAPTVYSSTASSSFNSLQAQFSGRFRGCIQVNSSYTYSHAIDDASDLFDLSGAFALPQDSFNSSERASASFDVRHRFAGTFIWDIAPHKSSAWLGGWQLAGIWTVQSGQPFTVNSAFDINGDGNLTDRLQTMQGIHVGPVSNDSPTLIRIDSSVALRSLLAATGTDGSVGRNTFRSWGVRTADVAATKVINLRRSEADRLTLRLECFNVFNHPQFAIPVRILESPSFGRAVQTTIPARTFQVVVKWFH